MEDMSVKEKICLIAALEETLTKNFDNHKKLSKEDDSEILSLTSSEFKLDEDGLANPLDIKDVITELRDRLVDDVLGR